ncbi:MAG: 2,3-bisphosphoglycerate-independent phosphoglycerate mutase [Pelovirga sp.]
MMTPDFDFISPLLVPAKTRIIMLVIDGLGGLPVTAGGQTELEAASSPNLDMLAAEGIGGLHQPVGTGITPGSGPSHLALFGYDPRQYQVGRGVLSALGGGFNLQDGDVAARGNFCTMDDSGLITDRRAGRIDTSTNRKLCEILREIELPGVELFIEPVKEYRFLLVLRGSELSAKIADSDPQQTGHKPREPDPLIPDAEHTAQLVQHFLEQAHEKLATHEPANMVLLRGFSSRPAWPSFNEVFGLKAAAVAGYPLYRGVAQLLGMEILDCEDTLDSKMAALKEQWEQFDFFYVHYKPTDSAGEDGDAEKKQRCVEEMDQIIPALRELQPEVLIVTGDHSSPAPMKAHSWHPVPTVLWGDNCRPDEVTLFGERACVGGGLGPRFAATDLIPLALAHAGRLQKFGA